MAEAIIEKDFWVCWVLDYLFQESSWKDRLTFKGGTSLSKAFGAIERFSEDIDLILDWRLLGYSEQDPWTERSHKKQDAFGKEANRKTVDFLRRDFAPKVRTALGIRAGVPIGVEAEGENILIHYPKSFSLDAVLPQIRLEFGPMAAWNPNEPRSIRSYAAEQFPELFNHPETTVRTTTAERTFWEKATILHQEAHRPADSPLPRRYSRHYYDLFKLSLLPIRAKALENMNLLTKVVKFKRQFYHCAWARFEDAMPGGLKLLPPNHHLAELNKDYRAMEAMLFGAIPRFEAIIGSLADLEAEINNSGNRKK